MQWNKLILASYRVMTFGMLAGTMMLALGRGRSWG